MKLMLLKKEFDALIEFMENQAAQLGLSHQEIDQIQVETATHLRFSFPGSTSQLELIRRLTKKVASFLSFTTEALEDIGLAIDEACANVINHSYQGQPGIIQVAYVVDSAKLTITLVDSGQKGQQFNPELLSPVNQEEYLKRLSKGGLGVYLIKKIMDEVEYTVTPGVKNCLKMVKYVASGSN